VKPATSTTWQSCIDKWLDTNLEDSCEHQERSRQDSWLRSCTRSGLSPKSISNYAGLLVASAIGDDVAELSPRGWNHESLDIPLVENRRCPSISGHKGYFNAQSGPGKWPSALSFGAGLRRTAKSCHQCCQTGAVFFSQRGES